MPAKKLSPREKEIVELSVMGLTNDAIAIRLGLSVGTVNTYWLRIRLKTGGIGRTDTVATVVKDQAKRELDAERVDWSGIEAILEKREIFDLIGEKSREIDLRTALALLHLAVVNLRSTVWSTDRDLTVQVIENGDLPSARWGVKWEVGKTIYDIFKTADKAHPAVVAHLGALAGSESEQYLSGEFAGSLLKVIPLVDESGETICCLSVLTIADK